MLRAPEEKERERASQRQRDCISARHSMDCGARRNIRLTSVLIAAFLGLSIEVACTSSTVAVTAPAAPKCDVTATSSIATAPPGGATATVSVDTTRDCAWSASTNVSWIALG